MWVRGFERVCLSASVAIALLTPAISQASGQEIPVTQGSDGAPRSVSGASLGGYARVLVAPLELGYTKGFLASNKLRDFRFKGADLERIRRYYREIVTAKLASAYPIASEPGPAVVRVEALLIDPVLDKRDWLVPTRIVFRSAPRVRLIALLSDSQTGKNVGSVGFNVRPRGDRLMKESPGFYWHFMRRVFDRIATRVRWTLEDGAEESS